MLSRVFRKFPLAKLTGPVALHATNLLNVARNFGVTRILAGSNPSSKFEREFSKYLVNQIKHESDTHVPAEPPKGFTVSKREESKTIIMRKFADGSQVVVTINLAGAVQPDIDNVNEESEQNTPETDASMDVRPEVSIRIVKPSGKALVYNCSLPSSEETSEDEEKSTGTFLVDSVEMETLPGYFVYSDLLDDEMYDHFMQILSDRGLNDQFQNELREFCAAEEHMLYRQFLGHLKEFCDE